MSNPPSPTNSNNSWGEQETVHTFEYRHSYTLKEIPSQIFYLKDQQARFNAAEYNNVLNEIFQREQPSLPTSQATLMQAPHRKPNFDCHSHCCTSSQDNTSAALVSPIPPFRTNARGVRVY